MYINNLKLTKDVNNFIVHVYTTPVVKIKAPISDI